MRTKVLLGMAALAVVIIAGCAGSGGWKTIETPTDANFYFATGTSESADLQLAIDKATLNARAEIGRQLELKLNSLQKSFAEEVGDTDPELNKLYSSATEVVVSTQLSGSKIKDTKYQEKNGKYHAVVLVEYPVNAANAALVNQIKKDQALYTRFRASEGFKELEAEVEKYENWKKEKGQE